MIVWLLVGIALAVAIALILRGFVGADPKSVAKILRWTAVGLVGLLGLALIGTGRLSQAIMLASVLVPLFVRWKAVWNRVKAAAGPKPGQTSAVETGLLAMELDHDTGSLDGRIKSGRFAARRLGELGLAELIELLRECAASDPSSVPLVEAFLDRAHPDWRRMHPGAADGGGADRAGGFAGAMTPAEAREILGVGEGAGEDEIRDAHRKLMMKNHPDQGGSTYLATKINQAKDVLLGRRA